MAYKAGNANIHRNVSTFNFMTPARLCRRPPMTKTDSKIVEIIDRELLKHNFGFLVVKALEKAGYAITSIDGDTTALEDETTLAGKLSQLSVELSERGWDPAAVKACLDGAKALAPIDGDSVIASEALRPFAEAADRYDKCRDDRPLIYTMQHDETLTVGDLRKAKNAFSAPVTEDSVTVPRELTPAMRKALQGWDGVDAAWARALAAAEREVGT